jgi:hypothetical protein
MLMVGTNGRSFHRRFISPRVCRSLSLFWVAIYHIIQYSGKDIRSFEQRIYDIWRLILSHAR